VKKTGKIFWLFLDLDILNIEICIGWSLIHEYCVTLLYCSCVFLIELEVLKEEAKLVNVKKGNQFVHL
jgi:hypothetical protein